ncbi:MAG: hypothetical protein TR69_WS6001000063 [candidate division WS6 bacterium OLB20]|uniref:Uncharacterized protein n=1 Tax=candidate division WS6 bacterium OLB20 TaxID=1617426 RepID=A0A136M143_9BACT|nr:MAG: hypothetical protein TR69_WS6001000063 [candidate division WS6 bacterium OLB20]
MDQIDRTAFLTDFILNKDALTRADRQRLVGELYTYAELYNLEGISRPERLLALESGSSFAAVSDIGGSVHALEIAHLDVYFSGRAPYLLAGLDASKDIRLHSPLFYRMIGHHVIPVQNQFPGINPDVHTMLEELTGKQIAPGYDTGHHGAGQCRRGELSRTGGVITWDALHFPDQWNLFNLHETMNVWFEGDSFYQEVKLTNTNDHPIPVSLLHHPYFVNPAASLDGARVDLVSTRNKKRKLLFDLGRYVSDGEQRFNGIPVLERDQELAFTRSDGTELRLGYYGDYDQTTGGIQIFSNGPTNERLLADFAAKHELHRKRRAAMHTLLTGLGFEHSDPAADDMEDFTRTQQQLNGLTSVCIEVNTSGGNIYADEDSGAVILQPGESRRYGYRVRRES